MQTVLPREEAVEAVISKVLGSQEACDRLNEVFYEHLENCLLYTSDAADEL